MGFVLLFECTFTNALIHTSLKPWPENVKSFKILKFEEGEDR